jgi:hypothetical protein
LQETITFFNPIFVSIGMNQFSFWRSALTGLLLLDDCRRSSFIRIRCNVVSYDNFIKTNSQLTKLSQFTNFTLIKLN